MNLLAEASNNGGEMWAELLSVRSIHKCTEKAIKVKYDHDDMNFTFFISC